MATTFAGIGSGLDLESMVTQLVQAERQGPIQRINRVEARANQENKAFDAVNSSMSALQNAAKALEDAVAGRAMKAVVPEGAAFSITAGASAAESTFDVEVEAIAGAQKLRSTALDAETSLGNGTLTLSANSPDNGQATEEVDVDYTASAIEIGFNSRYLIDIADQIDDGNKAVFLMADAASPTIVTDEGDDGALYVLMPMRV